MKKVLLVSDSHGRIENYRKMINAEGPDIDFIYHMGDVEGDVKALRDMCPAGFLAVRGNCDYDLSLDNERVVTIGRHRVYICHGHRVRVNMFHLLLTSEAKKNSCDMAFYGHTHRPFMGNEDGVFVVNPGSISMPRQADGRPGYVVIEIDDSGELLFTQKYIE